MADTKKVVRQLDQNGKTIREWDLDQYSLKDIARELGDEKQKGNLSAVLNRKRNTCFGSQFVYADKPLNKNNLFSGTITKAQEEAIQAWLQAPNITDLKGNEIKPEELDYSMVDFKAFNERARALMTIDPRTGRPNFTKAFKEGCWKGILTYPEVRVKVSVGGGKWEMRSCYDLDSAIILLVRYYQLRYGQEDPDFWNADTLKVALAVGYSIFAHNCDWLELCISRAWFRAVRDGNSFCDNFYAKSIGSVWYHLTKEEDSRHYDQMIAKDDPWPFECKDYILDDFVFHRPDLLRQYINTGGYIERPVYTDGKPVQNTGMFDLFIYGP